MSSYKLNEGKFLHLIERLNHLQESELINLIGDVGLGKSTVLSSLQAHAAKLGIPVLRITGNDEKGVTALEPILAAIYPYLRDNTTLCYSKDIQILAHSLHERANSETLNFDMHHFLLGSHQNYHHNALGLSREERIKYLLTRVLTSNKTTVFIIENVVDINENLLNYLTEFISSCIRQKLYKIFFLIEENSDDRKRASETNDWFKSLVPFSTSSVYFEKFEETALATYLTYEYEGLSRWPETLKIISTAASGNLHMLLIILGTLRHKNLLYKVNNLWQCKDFDPSEMAEYTQDYLMMRYERLNESQKEVLHKSSIIGMTIHYRLLYQPFDVIYADHILREIEQISSIIKEQHEGSYSFENKVSHELIYNQAKQYYDPKSWHLLIAEHLEKLYLQNPKEFQRNYRLEDIANHYKKSNQLEKSFRYYLRLIPLYLAEMNYMEANVCIATAIHLSKYFSTDPTVQLALCLQYARSQMFLAQYAEAIKQFEQVLKDKTVSSDLEMEIKYALAECYYMDGKPEKSLEIILLLKKRLENTKVSNLLLQVKIFSMLASIYEWYCDLPKCDFYFALSLDICYKHKELRHELEEEYYRLLRKQNMVKSADLCFPYMEASANYFKNHNLKEYHKTLHNLGSAKMQYQAYDESRKYLNDSRTFFETYYSLDASYPINSLGILTCLEKENYYKAIELFDQAYRKDMLFFLQICLFLNKAACYRKLSMFEESYVWINHAIKALREVAETPDMKLLQRNVLLNLGYLHRDMGEYQQALNFFEKSFYTIDYTKVKSFATGLIAKNCVQIARRRNESLPDEIHTFALSVNQVTALFHDKDIYLCETLFWD